MNPQFHSILRLMAIGRRNEADSFERKAKQKRAAGLHDDAADLEAEAASYQEQAAALIWAAEQAGRLAA